jgi:hypothetical protein
VPEPRELAVKAGEFGERHPHQRTHAFAGDIGSERGAYVLLAMQKVEGSNPFSRFPKRPAFAGLLVSVQLVEGT